MSAHTNSNKNACRMFAMALVFPVIPARVAPDLSVTKIVDDPQPGVGQPVEFTIQLTNVRADAALSAQVLDMLPTGTAIPQGAAAFPSVGAYGATLDPHVDSLLRFRDRYLVTNS